MKKIISQHDLHSSNQKSEENKIIAKSVQVKILKKLEQVEYQKKAAQILQLWINFPSQKK